MKRAFVVVAGLLAGLGLARAFAQEESPVATLQALVGTSQPVFRAGTTVFPGEGEPSLFLFLVNDGAKPIEGDMLASLIEASELTVDGAPWWTARDFRSARLAPGRDWAMRLGLGDLAKAVATHEVIWKGRGFEARARFRVVAGP